ncbi:GNAT family N-acetyltransferase [Chitinophaga sp. MM2321]|uniref:GNAT family N-acetyltransferase n=1 Tax=Chitinophaga sp. MM2321 TaxID=3137178 RepID=UPI0032D57AA0
MHFREATIDDIPGLFKVRFAVKENRLNNPDLATREDCERYLTTDGKGWVCEAAGNIVGFAIIDAMRNNIWALFVDPGYEAQGIGKQLQTLMLDWHFSESDDMLWLGTSANTRAERFYALTGWMKTGMLDTGEVKFIITRNRWLQVSGLS